MRQQLNTLDTKIKKLNTLHNQVSDKLDKLDEFDENNPNMDCDERNLACKPLLKKMQLLRAKIEALTTEYETLRREEFKIK
jgi:prefoldin subunit 5